MGFESVMLGSGEGQQVTRGNPPGNCAGISSMSPFASVPCSATGTLGATRPLAKQVPPYARAGLYKQLSSLKELVREFREDPEKNASLRPVIAAQLEQAGLFQDLPYRGASAGDDGVLTAEAAEGIPAEGEVSGLVFLPPPEAWVNRSKRPPSGKNCSCPSQR